MYIFYIWKVAIYSRVDKQFISADSLYHSKHYASLFRLYILHTHIKNNVISSSKKSLLMALLYVPFV